MHVAAAQVLGADDLAGGRLHQRRPAEEDRALVAHDHGLVAHRGHVGAACRARSEHRGDLGDAAGAHRGLVEEDPAEMLAVREDLVLPGQERPARVDQVDAGQPVRERDLLRAQVLLDRHRVVGAALDGGVVGDHDALPAADPADAGDDAGAGGRVLVHALGRQRARSRGTGCPDRAVAPPGPWAAACRGTRAWPGTPRGRQAPGPGAGPAARTPVPGAAHGAAHGAVHRRSFTAFFSGRRGRTRARSSATAPLRVNDD